MRATSKVYRRALAAAALLVAVFACSPMNADAHGFGGSGFGVRSFGGYGGGFNSFAVPYGGCGTGFSSFAAPYGGCGVGAAGFGGLGYGGVSSFGVSPFAYGGVNSFRTFNTFVPTNRVFVASGFNRPFVAASFGFGNRGFGNRGFSAGFSFRR